MVEHSPGVFKALPWVIPDTEEKDKDSTFIIVH